MNARAALLTVAAVPYGTAESIEVEDRSSDPVRLPVPSDDEREIHDAYSQAVIGVVERAGPAVVSLEVGAGRGAGAGSGFAVTPDGYVLTNGHVVASRKKITVNAPNGESAIARVVGDGRVRRGGGRRRVLGELLQHGRVRRAWLGVGAIRRPLDRRLAYHHGLGRAAVEIQSVDSASPAANAGLRDGDLLVRFADKPIQGIDDLHRVLRSWPAGQVAALDIIRRGQRLSLDVTPALVT